MNEIIGTLIVSIVLAAIVAAVIRGMIKNKKQGRSSCGCGCSGCPNSSLCHGSADAGKRSDA